MDLTGDIATIVEQENSLVFPSFSPDSAFELGLIFRERSVRYAQGSVIDIRLWDRPLFWLAQPGTTADNAEWVRRKVNVVRRMHMSSYRFKLELQQKDRTMSDRALDPANYALAGGGFPIAAEGIGVIGSLTISGLPERDDHSLAVEIIAGYLRCEVRQLTSS